MDYFYLDLSYVVLEVLYLAIDIMMLFDSAFDVLIFIFLICYL
jgi:hypothetical protein